MKIRDMADLFVCKLASYDDFLLTIASSPVKKYLALIKDLLIAA